MVINTTAHNLVPKHAKLTDVQKKKFLEEGSVSLWQLPRIRKDDPAIAVLGAKSGDIIQIERSSPTAGTAQYYRVVIDG